MYVLKVRDFCGQELCQKGFFRVTISYLGKFYHFAMVFFLKKNHYNFTFHIKNFKTVSTNKSGYAPTYELHRATRNPFRNFLGSIILWNILRLRPLYPLNQILNFFGYKSARSLESEKMIQQFTIES